MDKYLWSQWHRASLDNTGAFPFYTKSVAIHRDINLSLTTIYRFSAIGTTVRKNRQQTTRKTAPIAPSLFLPF
ncbi:hypothetical protein NF634_002863 [Salmonella enterica]|nr:hypothetical protein [Salmonella enterica]